MSEANWEALRDLSEPYIALPTVGARFVMGIGDDGKRHSSYQIHYDDQTVTPTEVVGLVMVSLWEWMHQVLHDNDDEE